MPLFVSCLSVFGYVNKLKANIIFRSTTNFVCRDSNFGGTENFEGYNNV